MRTLTRASGKFKWHTDELWKPEPYMCQCGMPSMEWDPNNIFRMDNGVTLSNVMCDGCGHRSAVTYENIVIGPLYADNTTLRPTT